MVLLVRRFFILAAMLVAALGAMTWVFPRAEKLGQLPDIALPAGPVLVVAPHSDDETLAAGGLLEQAEAAGGQPRVVLVTVGDAFKLAAQESLRRINVGPFDMRAFGRRRLKESRAALEKLGVPADRLIFLGFPDRGLNRLWLEFWREDSPFRSPFTDAREVPYSEARYPGAPYAGRALLQQLTEVLRTVRPAVVVYPHPNEAHVDHWALSNFTVAALEELRRTEPGWNPPAEWLYLVHRGDWPAPKGFNPRASLFPPGKLTGGMTSWYMLPLTPTQVRNKAAAVNSYHTQTAILGRYLRSFVRANELFGNIGRVLLPSPAETRQSEARRPGASRPDRAAGVAAGGNSPPWPIFAWTQVIWDPAADTLARKVERGADLLAVWASRDESVLRLAASMDAPPSRAVEVRFYVRGFRKAAGWDDLATVVIGPGRAPKVEAWPAQPLLPLHASSTKASVRSAWVRMDLPLGTLGAPDAAMVNVETRMNGILIDRAAWRLVSLAGE